MQIYPCARFKNSIYIGQLPRTHACNEFVIELGLKYLLQTLYHALALKYFPYFDDWTP